MMPTASQLFDCDNVAVAQQGIDVTVTVWYSFRREARWVRI